MSTQSIGSLTPPPSLHPSSHPHLSCQPFSNIIDIYSPHNILYPRSLDNKMMSSPPTTPPRTQKKVRTAVGGETPSHPSSPADSQLDGGEYGANGHGTDVLAEKTNGAADTAAEEHARYSAEAEAEAGEAKPAGWR